MVTCLTNQTEFYQVNNVIMTKSHLVMSKGKWRRAGEIGNYLTTSNNQLIYCPICDSNNHELVVGYNNLTTKDYNELENPSLDNYLLNYSLAKLNCRLSDSSYSEYSDYQFTREQLSEEVGVSAESYLNKNDGTYIKAKQVEIGDLLDTGKVLAIIKFTSKNKFNYQITPKLQITARQIIYDNNNWKLPNYKFSKNKIKANSIYYSFYTTSGIYKSDNIILADMFDGQSPNDIVEFNKLIEKYVN